MLKCPYCEKKTRAIVSKENSPQKFVCPKCKKEVRSSIMQCCTICTFSNKRCPYSLYMWAKARGLEIRE